MKLLRYAGFVAALTVIAIIASAAPQLDKQFINFGYIQHNSIIPVLPWKTLTHVGPPFVNFDENGNFVNSSGNPEPTGGFSSRNSALRAGGAAQAAGTKVIAIVRNYGFQRSTLDSVFQDPAKWENLAQNVKTLVMSDSYCAGVNFDFEPNWAAASTGGMTAFYARLREILPADYEISTYVHPTFNSTLYDIPNTHPHLDYILYSTYDWATGTTPRSVSRFNSAIGQARNYLNAGVPPEKLVLTWAFYGGRWPGTDTYNVTGTGDRVSQGFFNGMWDTTLRKNNSGPFTSNYVTADETAWHTFNVGGTNYTTTWDNQEGLELRLKAAQSFPASGSSPFNGVKLGGVGWWSLMWNSNYFDSFQAHNPRTNATVTRPRHYIHGYEQIGEILSPPGKHPYIFESFEGLNPFWETPTALVPDTTAGSYAVAIVSAPTGTGRPADTTNAARLTYNFSTATNRRVFFRHTLLNDFNEKTVTDTNATICHVTPNTTFRGYYYTASTTANTQLRMALRDGNGEVELSPIINLSTKSGWNQFEWNINDSTQISAGTTADPTLKNGNGVLNTAGNGIKDISFLGFVLTSSVNGSRTIFFDELTYEERSPENKHYVINEFRFANQASEFVEIAGPPGVFPSDTQLRFYDSSTGNVASSVDLTGKVIPANGLFVIGDTGVPNVNFVPTGWGASRNIPNTAPAGMQIYNPTLAFAYDSVTYKALGGLSGLARMQTNGVTYEGFPWIGDVASGTDTTNAPYTMGRFPDGDDTNVNQKDFSFMKATPGQPNGNPAPLNTTINFSTPPTALFQTYKSPQFVQPSSVGIPNSPNGGLAYKLVDSAGGGVMAAIGDPGLGENNGLELQCQLYLPAGNALNQAVGVGFCGNQGSAFFSTDMSGSGYESGYWVIYENTAGILNHGLSSEPGKLRFIYAKNDNMQSARAYDLAVPKSLTELGVAAGQWINITMQISKTNPVSSRLSVKVDSNNQAFTHTLFEGAIPEGGPTHGPVQFGYRRTGTPTSTSGTWVDGVMIKEFPNARVEDFMLY